MGIVVALLVLSFLIFFHELGHFLAARFFGVKVEVFSIGFGKALLKKQIGETEYRISAIPLGGYVKMLGQDDSDPTQSSDDARAYNRKKPWQRIVILLAGPLANILLAFLIYFVIALTGVPKLEPIIDKVKEGYPAAKAGLQSGDRIVAIDGMGVKYWEQVGPFIQQAGEKMVIEVQRAGKRLHLTLHPRVVQEQNHFKEQIKRRVIGITPKPSWVEVAYPIAGAVAFAWEQTLKASMLIVKSITKLIDGTVSTSQVSGVVGIVDFTAKASQSGILSLLFFVALLSVNLGILNLLPIPALDGGHILFNLYEMVTKRAPSQQAVVALTLFGWALLLGLLMLGLYNDLNRLMSKE